MEIGGGQIGSTMNCASLLPVLCVVKVPNPSPAPGGPTCMNLLPNLCVVRGITSGPNCASLLPYLCVVGGFSQSGGSGPTVCASLLPSFCVEQLVPTNFQEVPGRPLQPIRFDLTGSSGVGETILLSPFVIVAIVIVIVGFVGLPFVGRTKRTKKKRSR